MTQKQRTLAEALGKAHSLLGAVQRDSKNPHMRYTYASLGAVQEALRAPLQEAGIVFYQTPVIEGDGDSYGMAAGCRTTVMVVGGDPAAAVTFDTVLPIREPVNKQGDSLGFDPQSVGAGITYARRYALLSFFNLSTEDDDGQAASQRDHAPKRAQQPRQPARSQRMTSDGTAAPELTSKMLEAFDRVGVTRAGLEVRYGKPAEEIRTDPGLYEQALGWWRELSQKDLKEEAREAFDKPQKATPPEGGGKEQ